MQLLVKRWKYHTIFNDLNFDIEHRVNINYNHNLVNFSYPRCFFYIITKYNYIYCCCNRTINKIKKQLYFDHEQNIIIPIDIHKSLFHNNLNITIKQIIFTISNNNISSIKITTNTSNMFNNHNSDSCNDMLNNFHSKLINHHKQQTPQTISCSIL